MALTAAGLPASPRVQAIGGLVLVTAQNLDENLASVALAQLSSSVLGMPSTCADDQPGKRRPPFFRAGSAE
jgi:hypothetical protein